MNAKNLIGRLSFALKRTLMVLSNLFAYGLNLERKILDIILYEDDSGVPQ
jgi:hypothetical protein